MSPLFVQAQMDDSRIGIKGGLNASNFYREQVGDQNARLGFHVGLFTEIAVGEAFSIQPELVLSTKGNRATYGADDGVLDLVGAEGEVSTNLTYIDIPILAKVTLGEIINLHVGPYASYLIGASTSTEGDLASGSEELDRDNFKSWDYGLAAGLGVDLAAVTIGARYNLGLVNIAKTTVAEGIFDNSKNSVLQAYIAIGL
ncbi:porin family protein [Catalinimonas niigatensis]|uniref:porin family protein n=1 Tax=Catalinimonas niigatensis TaxID=1397264 RepID=UPI002666BA60|nr:porin family protein [Catalinimonas niigatensis]WPP48142.1 porin family protein [Catalinimonas niigatensis]